MKNLFKKYLDFAFEDDSKGISVRVLERPGKWMPAAELKAIVEELRSVVKESIPAGNLEYGVLNEGPQMEQAILTIIYDKKTGKALAFNALAYMECELRGQTVDVLHLGLVIVSPNCREGGFSWILYGLTSMILFFRNRFRPIWISNVTQVPAIIGKVTETFSAVYPSPTQDRCESINHIILARQILSKHRSVFGVGEEAVFDESHFVIQNAYTGGSDHLKKTFEQAQPHRRDIYNDFCKNHLDYNRGDDFLQLGILNLNACRNYLVRSIPRRSLGGLALGLGMLALQSALLPVVHWFDGKHQQGHVRPWV